MTFTPLRRSRSLDACLLGVICLLLATPSWAQDDANKGANASDDEKFLNGSTETHIQTLDGVYLNVRLWIPEKVKTPKETPIVVLLHMRGRSQRDWFPFAKFLCDKGFAVCTFDFRGHGQSRDVNPEVYVKASDAMQLAETRQGTGSLALSCLVVSEISSSCSRR